MMGLAPGDKMKKIGVLGVESSNELTKIKSALKELSQSTKAFPFGSVFLTNWSSELVMRSGLRHLVTSIF